MVSPDMLADVRPAEYVGQLKVPGEDNSPVPGVAVFEGELPPEAAKKIHDADNIKVYQFRQLTTLADELIFANGASATVAVQPEEGDPTGAEVTLLVTDPGFTEAKPTSIFRDGTQFRTLMSQLVGSEGYDHMDMKPEGTNLTPEAAQDLGFKALTGDPNVLHIDLSAAHTPVAV